MIASTCLAVLFVPTFFVVVQRFENWLKRARRGKRTDRKRSRRRRCDALTWHGELDLRHPEECARCRRAPGRRSKHR